jgi:hypothetical protein
MKDGATDTYHDDPTAPKGDALQFTQSSRVARDPQPAIEGG